MSDVDYDVVIVGCGPVGMVLAGLLANDGVRVLAIEQEDQIGYRPRARHLDAEAMRILQTIGVAEASEKTMTPLQGFRLADASGRALMEQPVDSVNPGEQGWLVDYQMFQPLLLQILFDHLGASGRAVVRTGHEVTALDQHHDHVGVSVTERASGAATIVTAQYVVGCDGGDSWVRETIGSHFQALGPSHRYLVIDATPLRPDFRLPAHPVSVNVCDPARPHYVSPGNESVPTRFEFMVMPDDDEAELVTPASIARLTAPYLNDGDVRFDRAAVYTFHSLLVDEWRVGRVLLAGDAAHVQPPFMGQGLCSGFRDAANLSWKLAMVCRGDSGEWLLDSYKSERSQHARDWINEANRVGAIVMTTDPAKAAERDERLLGGNFKEIRPIRPILGPGLHLVDPPPAGTLAPQPFLPDGRRLDELVGQRFLVAAAHDIWRAVSPEIRRAVQETPHVLVATEAAAPEAAATGAAAPETAAPESAAAEAVALLTSHYNTKAVVVRPDRYVLGVADDPAGLERVLLRIPSLARSALTPGGSEHS